MSRPPKCYICQQRWVGEPVKLMWRWDRNWSEHRRVSVHPHCIDMAINNPELADRELVDRALHVVRYTKEKTEWDEDERERREAAIQNAREAWNT